MPSIVAFRLKKFLIRILSSLVNGMFTTTSDVENVSFLTA